MHELNIFRCWAVGRTKPAFKKFSPEGLRGGEISHLSPFLPKRLTENEKRWLAVASKAHQSSFNRTWRSNQSLLVTEINLSCLERWCNSPCIVLYLTPSPACDGAACGDSGDPQKLASVQVNSGVTKRRRGWRLALNRDGGGCRVTCTCARTTCPDGIHLHTKKKTKNTPPCPILPNMWVSADTCGGAEQCLMGQWGVRFHPDATGPEVDLRHQLPPVSTQHASSLAGVWGWGCTKGCQRYQCFHR